jgi:hypothetical protein
MTLEARSRQNLNEGCGKRLDVEITNFPLLMLIDQIQQIQAPHLL